MKPASPDSCISVHAEMMRLLEERTARGGLTPGQLRAELGKTGVRCDLAEVRGACHDLWLRDEVVIEPPGRGKREFRVWHAAQRRPMERSGMQAGANRPVPQGRPSREGGMSAEESFRATMCGQLVGEWEWAGSQETREVLRRLLANFGAERVETPQEVVPFKGRRHHCDRTVLPGQPVRVMESGWLLRQGLGENLLAEARVAAP